MTLSIETVVFHYVKYSHIFFITYSYRYQKYYAVLLLCSYDQFHEERLTFKRIVNLQFAQTVQLKQAFK